MENRIPYHDKDHDMDGRLMLRNTWSSSLTFNIAAYIKRADFFKPRGFLSLRLSIAH